jgi:hypothetical protein
MDLWKFVSFWTPINAGCLQLTGSMACHVTSVADGQLSASARSSHSKLRTKQSPISRPHMLGRPARSIWWHDGVARFGGTIRRADVARFGGILVARSMCVAHSCDSTSCRTVSAIGQDQKGWPYPGFTAPHAAPGCTLSKYLHTGSCSKGIQ